MTWLPNSEAKMPRLWGSPNLAVIRLAELPRPPRWSWASESLVFDHPNAQRLAILVANNDFAFLVRWRVFPVDRSDIPGTKDPHCGPGARRSLHMIASADLSIGCAYLQSGPAMMVASSGQMAMTPRNGRELSMAQDGRGTRRPASITRPSKSAKGRCVGRARKRNPSDTPRWSRGSPARR